MRIRLAPVLVAGLGLLLASGGVQAQTAQPCTGENCVEVTVVSPDGEFRVGDTVTVPIRFQQGPDALGDQAAIAFTLSLGPPDATTAALRLENCDDPTPDGITSAIEIPPGVADLFRVVVENTTCTSDTKPCLCPGEGQLRANYANVVVFGPKVLPTPGSGEVDFPLLPNDVLMSIRLVIDSATVDPIPLHLFAETDPSTLPKPGFGARLSIGDTEATDDTLDPTRTTSNVRTNDGQINVAGLPSCVGDCDGNCEVSLLELQTGLDIFFGDQQVSACPAFSTNGETVTLLNLQQGLDHFFDGCPSSCVPRQ